jgi:serine/threonine protein kinase
MQPDMVNCGSETSRLNWLEQELPEQYELLEMLSAGGMGAIYKAQNRYTGANVAIKVLYPECAHDPEIWRRFITEAKALSALKHPNICQMYDFGISHGEMPYLVMEWINGISVERKVERDGPLSVREAVQIFQQISAALSQAHQKKVVHRDLKPGNILLTRDLADGRTIVHLVDFGIAKEFSDQENKLQTEELNAPATVVGTPAYMSPEQARGASIDWRSDVYSLGCVMYFVLTGNPPFIGEKAGDILHKQINEEPPETDPALKIPSDLKKIMFKAMQKNPDHRYDSLEHLARDLRRITKDAGLVRRSLSSERWSVGKTLITAGCLVIGFLSICRLLRWHHVDRQS